MSGLCKDFDPDCFDMTKGRIKECFKYDQTQGICPFTGCGYWIDESITLGRSE